MATIVDLFEQVNASEQEIESVIDALDEIIGLFESIVETVYGDNLYDAMQNARFDSISSGADNKITDLLSKANRPTRLNDIGDSLIFNLDDRLNKTKNIWFKILDKNKIDVQMIENSIISMLEDVQSDAVEYSKNTRKSIMTNKNALQSIARKAQGQFGASSKNVAQKNYITDLIVRELKRAGFNLGEEIESVSAEMPTSEFNSPPRDLNQFAQRLEQISEKTPVEITYYDPFDALEPTEAAQLYRDEAQKLEEQLELGTDAKGRQLTPRRIEQIKNEIRKLIKKADDAFKESEPIIDRLVDFFTEQGIRLSSQRPVVVDPDKNVYRLEGYVGKSFVVKALMNEPLTYKGIDTVKTFNLKWVSDTIDNIIGELDEQAKRAPEIASAISVMLAAKQLFKAYSNRMIDTPFQTLTGTEDEIVN